VHVAGVAKRKQLKGWCRRTVDEQLLVDDLNGGCHLRDIIEREKSSVQCWGRSLPLARCRPVSLSATFSAVPT